MNPVREFGPVRPDLVLACLLHSESESFGQARLHKRPAVLAGPARSSQPIAVVAIGVEGGDIWRVERRIQPKAGHLIGVCCG